MAAVIGPDEVLATLRPFPLSVKAPTPYYPTATDKTRFVGEPVAVVVAADRYFAEDAAELVEIDYEVLPAVVRTDQALEEDAPRLHDQADSNVATDRTFTFGEVDAAFDRARPHGDPQLLLPALLLHADGVLRRRRRLAGPRRRARGHRLVELPRTVLDGPGGGRQPRHPDLVAAAHRPGRHRRQLRHQVGRLPLHRTDGPRQQVRRPAGALDRGPARAPAGQLVRVRPADDVLGRRRRRRSRQRAARRPRRQRRRLPAPPEPSTLYRCFGNITGAYRIDEVEIRARAVVTNKAPTGLNRGFGGQQLYFGLERLIDDIAVELGLDPADVRRRNLLDADQFPYATPSGGIYDSGDYHRAFELALENVDYDRLRKEQAVARDNGEWMGIGMATIVDPSATNIGYVGLATPVQDRTAKRGKSGSTEHVRISVDLQGVVSVLLGTVPQGQGHATVARDVVASHLGLPVEQVRPRVEMDTASTPWTISSGSYSSRFAPLLTSALLEAADRIAATIKIAAGVLLEADPETPRAGRRSRCASIDEP